MPKLRNPTIIEETLATKELVSNNSFNDRMYFEMKTPQNKNLNLNAKVKWNIWPMCISKFSRF